MNEFWRIESADPLWGEVLSLGARREYSQGEVVIEAGQEVNKFYFIEKGQICLVRVGLDGTEKLLMRVEEGAFFGESPLLSEVPMLSSFVCSKKSVLREFSKECLLNVILPYRPALMHSLLRTLAQKVNMFSNQVADLALTSLPHRICKFLLLANGRESLDAREPMLRSPLTQLELASLLGVHRITLYKALKELENLNVLSAFTRKQAKVLDVKEFLRYARGDDFD